ncbi:hypothetical protein [Cohnella hongkongensis]|uniref:Uncharacterized protein n=1 Tax=Cohnella hongkongensis TaxID=178337 RepID=A0ABV9FGY7_9BACL
MFQWKRQFLWRRIALAGIAFGLSAGGSLPVSAKPPASEPSTIELVVRASRTADMYSSLTIASPSLSARVAQAERIAGERADDYPDLEVTVRKSSGRKSVYRLERTGQLWDETSSSRLRLPADASDRLLGYAETLRRHHYGKLMTWREARQVVTRKSRFTITDLETGLSFRVQRRAGSSHADVQPVTKEDSKLMKRIYGGTWSWERRAIVVTKGGERIAASMNGMPHGGDGIPGNGFKGHFCVHFLGSTSHRSDTPDPAHQLMVYKASGELRRYFDSASPHELTTSFVEAMNRKDGDMLRLLWPEAANERMEALNRLLDRLESIRIERRRMPLSDEPDDQLSAAVELPVLVRTKERGAVRAKLRFEVVRSSAGLPWRIVGLTSDHSSLIP